MIDNKRLEMIKDGMNHYKIGAMEALKDGDSGISDELIILDIKIFEDSIKAIDELIQTRKALQYACIDISLQCEHVCERKWGDAECYYCKNRSSNTAMEYYMRQASAMLKL